MKNIRIIFLMNLMRECEKITVAYDEISKIKHEIQTIKNYKVCSSCGAEVTGEDAFCSKCGYKFETQSQEIVESESKELEQKNFENVCPNCNEVLERDVKFCTKCGYKVEE